MYYSIPQLIVIAAAYAFVIVHGCRLSIANRRLRCIQVEDAKEIQRLRELVIDQAVEINGAY